MLRRRSPTFTPLHAFCAAVLAAGLGCGVAILVTAHAQVARAPLWHLVLFGFCATLSELLPLRVFSRHGRTELTATGCYAMALLVCGGPLAALAGIVVAIAVADGFRGRPLRKIAFKLAQYSIATGAAGLVVALTTALPRPGMPDLLPADLPGVLLAAATFVVVNAALVTGAVALERGQGVGQRAILDLLRDGASSTLLLAVAPVIVVAADFSPFAVVLLFVPMIAIHGNGRAAEAKEHEALHDGLTGLPNRRLFRDRVSQALSAGRRSGEPAVVMLMDLDRFKDVNDTLGHRHGDLLLQEVARRVAGTLRASDTVARLGGDEFGILLPAVARLGDAAVVAQQVLAAVRRPFAVEGLDLEIDASIGVALHPAHASDVEELLQRADIAMYAAKQSGRGYASFEPDLDERSPRRVEIAGGLAAALEEQRIALHYQPQADPRTGVIAGVEALVRWEHPELGLIGPSEFVPIAEQTGLVASFTSHVLTTALAQLARWDADGLDLFVAVNLSPCTLLDARLAVELPQMLQRAGVDPARLQLELTEGVLLSDPARAAATLERLSAVGVRLAVDDFGTGHSSLANLKRLPVDVIKIDKSFVVGLAVDAADAAIVRSTVELAHSLGMEAVAEGVETEPVLERLADLGCDLVQGYHLSRPLQADAVAPLVRARAALRAA